ncbi:uncharacterized protein [Rhodnius prolixus]|uniref:uncharacterized protein n=1 Tax=Rhodnius prolixus TaxID=13249 RepID=UPI003D188B3E
MPNNKVFEERSYGISNVIGAIDGCHIPIKQPVRNAIDFYNRKNIIRLYYKEFVIIPHVLLMYLLVCREECTMHVYSKKVHFFDS